MTPLWKIFEDEFIIKLKAKTFKQQDVVAYCGDAQMASDLIQGYKSASRAKNRKTKYVMARQQGRTSNAVWGIGHTAEDARKVVRMFASDIMCKLGHDVDPLMAQIAQNNPRAVPLSGEINREIGRLVQQLEDLAGV